MDVIYGPSTHTHTYTPPFSLKFQVFVFLSGLGVRMGKCLKPRPLRTKNIKLVYQVSSAIFSYYYTGPREVAELGSNSHVKRFIIKATFSGVFIFLLYIRCSCHRFVIIVSAMEHGASVRLYFTL